MIKVLHISKYYYPFVGGVEQVARDITDSMLSNSGIQQKIICFNDNTQDGDYICHSKETVHDMVDGVEVIRCGCFAKVASQSLSFTYRRELKKVLQEFQPDIVILHYPNPFVSSFLLPLLSKTTKFILWWHLDITKQKFLGKLFHGQTMKLLKRSNQIVATSPNYIDGSPYLSKFKDKCVVIPNCVRPERLSVSDYATEKAAEIRQKYAGKTICFAVGRHVPYKGMAYLVKASKYLDDGFAILIGGKGELTETLKEEAKVDSKVEFLGRISDKDLIAYYLACDIFAFPSITKNEAFGIALAEGMYFGKPAVTFTILGSGVNYVNLDGVTGIECPNGDSKAYAKALKKLADCHELREEYGENCRIRVEENFLFDKFRNNVSELINEVK